MTTAIQQNLEVEINKISMEIQLLESKKQILQAELDRHVRQYQMVAELGKMNAEGLAAIAKLVRANEGTPHE